MSNYGDSEQEYILTCLSNIPFKPFDYETLRNGHFSVIPWCVGSNRANYLILIVFLVSCDY